MCQMHDVLIHIIYSYQTQSVWLVVGDEIHWLSDLVVSQCWLVSVVQKRVLINHLLPDLCRKRGKV